MKLELFIKKCKDIAYQKYIGNFNVKTSWLTYLYNCGIADGILQELKDKPIDTYNKKYCDINHFKKQIYEY